MVRDGVSAFWKGGGRGRCPMPRPTSHALFWPQWPHLKLELKDIDLERSCLCAAADKAADTSDLARVRAAGPPQAVLQSSSMRRIISLPPISPLEESNQHAGGEDCRGGLHGVGGCHQTRSVPPTLPPSRRLSPNRPAASPSRLVRPDRLRSVPFWGCLPPSTPFLACEGPGELVRILCSLVFPPRGEPSSRAINH
jgi:hypothetical protein